MHFLAAGPDIAPIQQLITTWTHIAQALAAGVVALVAVADYLQFMRHRQA